MAFLDRLRGLLAPEPTVPGPLVRRPAPAERGRAPIRLSLALQGGGSFGAFTWGVLDALLENEDILFDCVSGSSAGAINAALLASGLAEGGRSEARRRLERFWRRVSGAAPAPPMSLALSMATRMFSPYQFNPLDLNPLRALLESEIDFERLRASSPVRLLIGATRVLDGRLKVFDEHEMTNAVLLASACLPLLQQAVEIDGVAYWDGAYAANPPLIPLVQATEATTILVVQIVPSHRDALPRSAPDIVRRLEHMTFNASLQRDLDVIAGLTDLLAQERGGAGRLGALSIETLAAENFCKHLDQESALRLDWPFLSDLHEAGREAGRLWLAGGVDQGAGASGPLAMRPSPAAQSAVSPSRKVG